MDEIYNYLKIDDRIYTSGQPTVKQLRAAAEEGVQIVINLAILESDTALEDEAGLVHDLGMAYVHIPVVWDNPTTEYFEEFLRVMEQTAGKTVLIHCVANYRVTAFYSLYAMKTLGWSATEADALMAQIWEGGSYPIWDAFVKEIRTRILNHTQCEVNSE